MFRGEDVEYPPAVIWLLHWGNHALIDSELVRFTTGLREAMSRSVRVDEQIFLSKHMMDATVAFC